MERVAVVVSSITILVALTAALVPSLLPWRTADIWPYALGILGAMLLIELLLVLPYARLEKDEHA
jgi:hypothetical protein